MGRSVFQKPILNHVSNISVFTSSSRNECTDLHMPSLPTDTRTIMSKMYGRTSSKCRAGHFRLYH